MNFFTYNNSSDCNNSVGTKGVCVFKFHQEIRVIKLVDDGIKLHELISFSCSEQTHKILENRTPWNSNYF